MKILNQIRPKEVRAITQNMEQYTNFIVDNWEFLDSYQFLAAPLVNLAKNFSLQESKFLNSVFRNINERNLVGQKGFITTGILKSKPF